MGRARWPVGDGRGGRAHGGAPEFEAGKPYSCDSGSVEIADRTVVGNLHSTVVATGTCHATLSQGELPFVVPEPGGFSQT